MTKPPPGAAWAPPEYTVEDVTAMQALFSGRDVPAAVAKRAMDWIIDNACGTYDMSYRASSDRDTCFAEGKRFVGNQIIKLTKLNPNALRETHGRSSTGRSAGRDPGRDPDAERKS